VKDAVKGEVGCLKIATIHSAEMSMLQEILPRFTMQYPKVSFEFFEKESDVIVDMLEDGLVDIGIVRTPCRISEEMDVLYISDERLVCAYDPQVFSFDTDEKEIQAHQLGNRPLLFIRRYEEMIRSYFTKEMFQPQVRCINQQLNITLHWAEAGLGIAIIPEDMLAYRSKPMEYKLFADSSMTTKRAIITMKNSFHSRAVKNFLSLCNDLR
jgi:DNA-binding transcriptional LysR family regulator